MGTTKKEVEKGISTGIKKKKARDDDNI